jgi:hypothetical protein
MKKKLIVLGLVLGSPMLAFASDCTSISNNGGSNASNGTLFNLMCQISNVLNFAIPVLVTLAMVYFVWGVVTYVIASDEEAKSTGRNRMIWGIIGLVVIVGVWGLVSILANTFGLNGSVTESLPSVTVPAAPSL